MPSHALRCDAVICAHGKSLSQHLSKMRSMKAGKGGLAQRTHFLGDFKYLTEGGNDKADEPPYLAYCAKGLTPKADVPGCRRPLKLAGGDLAGFCNPEKQKSCFWPLNFDCKCQGANRHTRAGSWKRCECNASDFEAAVEAGREAEAERLRRKRSRVGGASTNAVSSCADVESECTQCSLPCTLLERLPLLRHDRFVFNFSPPFSCCSRPGCPLPFPVAPGHLSRCPGQRRPAFAPFVEGGCKPNLPHGAVNSAYVTVVTHFGKCFHMVRQLAQSTF
eukprot:5267845-Pleurochrysis_carterae.AAC.1